MREYAPHLLDDDRARAESRPAVEHGAAREQPRRHKAGVCGSDGVGMCEIHAAVEHPRVLARGHRRGADVEDEPRPSFCRVAVDVLHEDAHACEGWRHPMRHVGAPSEEPFVRGDRSPGPVARVA